jgi:hypothetical protein
MVQTFVMFSKYAGDRIKAAEMGYGVGGEERIMQGFDGKTWSRDRLEDPGADSNNIKMDLK